jgi:hypothetical protein
LNACGAPYYKDYLASIYFSAVGVSNLQFTPTVVSLPDGHKCVVMNVHGTLMQKKKDIHLVIWPFFKATETDFKLLPIYVNDIILRFQVQDRYIEEGVESVYYSPPTWLSYMADNGKMDLSFSGDRYNIIYDDSIKKFAYVAPLKVDYSPKYFSINFKTVLKNNEIIVTRKSFYVEYLTNTGTNEYTNAAIYYDHSKKKSIGTVPLRDGVLNKKEIISKFSSKLITQDYVFTKNKKGNYIFSEIR